MNGNNVIEARKGKQGITHIVSKGNGEKETIKYSAIRGSLSWPTPSSPGCSFILGEEYLYRSETIQRGVIHVLSEKLYEGISLDMMFSKLTDEVSRLHCETIYTDMNYAYVDFIEAYESFRNEKKIRLGYLDQAPFADNYMVGVSKIQDWLKNKRLHNPPAESAVHKELKIFSREDLGASPEINFPAINSLRYAVAAFDKYKPVRSSNRWKRRRRNAMVV
jgi:hypothetical protein